MLTPATCIYLVSGYTDMRKSIDGLALIVSDVLEMDPFSQAWFIFANKRRDKLKILRWDTNGFWLYYRRLEKGVFKWPKLLPDEAVSLSQAQLNWLLSGLEITHTNAHKPLFGFKL